MRSDGGRRATTHLLGPRRGPPLWGPCIPAAVPTASLTGRRHVSATFGRPGVPQRRPKSPPGEFLEPPRGFWNKHGDLSGVSAGKKTRLRAKQAPVRSGSEGGSDTDCPGVMGMCVAP